MAVSLPGLVLAVAGFVLRAILSICAALSGLWGFFALSYMCPGPLEVRWLAAGLWAILSFAAVIAVWRRRAFVSGIGYALCFTVLIVWWSTIAPSNTRDWADDVAQMASGTIDAHSVTIRNVRNFDWRSDTDYTPNWETRTYDLDALSSVDVLLSYWSSPAIAHTLVSFGFDTGEHVTFSVEIRKERSEAFSEIGGFFKQFETSVIAADERDIVRLRTTVRKEDVYLYRVAMPKAAIRSLFLAYVDQANQLVQTPRFYNTITANCTTVVYAMIERIVPGLPLDYRLVLSGYLPDYIFDVGGLTPGFTPEQLKTGGAISARGQAADRDPAFSQAIRKGVPGTGL